MDVQEKHDISECKTTDSLFGRLAFWKIPAREDLIEEYYVKLRSSYQICKQDAERFSKYPVITEKIDELFTQTCTLNNGAYIEQLMVCLYSPEQLQVEIDRKLYDIRGIQNQDRQGYYQKKNFGGLKDEEKRAAMVHLLSDLNSAYKTDLLERDYSLQTSLRTGIFFILSFFVFFMQYLFPGLTQYLFQITEAGTKGSLILTALSAGWMGAAFSMMMSLKRRLRESNLHDLGIQRRYGFIISRIFIGMGASMVMFYCLQSGLLKGDLFPVFQNIDELVSRAAEHMTPQSIITHKDQALLIIWCFIAGFSESLVPAILAKTEGMTR